MILTINLYKHIMDIVSINRTYVGRERNDRKKDEHPNNPGYEGPAFQTQVQKDLRSIPQ